MIHRGDEAGVATPYEIDDGRAKPMAFEWYVSTPPPPSSRRWRTWGDSCWFDLAAGHAGEQRILSEKLTNAMHEHQATVHPGVPGWSLGLQMDRVNGRTIAEHGGDIGGFSALFVLIPEEDAGFFIVNHGEGSDLRFKVKDALLDRLYPAKQPPVVPSARAEDAKRLAEYAGDYLSSIACRSCPRTPDDVFRVEANPDGTLSLWGQRWILAEADLFIRDDGKRRLGFARRCNGPPDGGFRRLLARRLLAYRSMNRRCLKPKGFSMTLSPFRRPSVEYAPTDAKAACHYPNSARALREAQKRGFDNAVLLDPLGKVSEFAISNIFYAKDGVVHTPVPNGTFLNGITRQRVIKLLRGAGIEVHERSVSWPEVLAADEIFSTGNFAKVMPVTRIEDQSLQPGPMFKRARELYWDFAHK